MLFITNLLGFRDDIDFIAKICKEKKILLIEDNCESLGTVYKGKKLGNYGLASTFSFYVGHHLSTIEGGAVCTDNTASDFASFLCNSAIHLDYYYVLVYFRVNNCC